jgi:ABC-2 type transport system ATP-binding protein
VKTTAAVTAAKTAAAKKAAAAKAAEEAAAAKAAEEAAAAEDVESAPAAEDAAPAAEAAETSEEAAETIETALPTGVAEGAIGEEPVAEEPAVEEPATAEPATAEPAAAEPVAAEPLAEETATGEPGADGPVVVEEPVVHAPVSDAPSDADGSPAEVDVAVPDAAVEPAAETFVPAAGGEAAIRIRGLVKTFGDHTAVNGIDLTVPAGSFYGIVGPNGAGKTTTLSIIAGLLRSDAGEVVISGVDQSTQPLAAKRILGVLPDRLRTFDRLTGRQLLYYYGLLRGLAASVIEKRVADLARAFDLGDALGRVVSDYSAGMTKKIMLAGAMIHSPRVLVLDEPFEAVDPVSSAVILDILRAYVAHGGTVILSSHGMDLVERVCSRVAIIVSGDVLAEGTIDEVRAGQTLESRFVELAGSSAEVEGLEWLHTFSD